MLLNVDQAATKLGTTSRHVRRLVAERQIAFVRVGRYIRLDDSDVDAYLSAARVEPEEVLRYSPTSR